MQTQTLIDDYSHTDVTFLLGRTWEDDQVQAFIAGWEQLEWIDEEDLDKAREDRRLSLMNEKLGLYLFFTDGASYRARYGRPRSSGDLILSRIACVFDYHPNWTPYNGELPLGLGAADTAATTISRLGEPARAWMAGPTLSKARWLTPEAIIDVSFVKATGGLKLVGLTPIPIASASPPQLSLPTPGYLANLFGQSLATLQRDPQLQVFDLGDKEAEIHRYREVDYSAELGMELYFKPGVEMVDAWPGAPRNGEFCLSGARYRADMDFQSNGYTGPLPWGLDMEDTIDVVMHKAGLAPFKQAIDDRDGYQRWRTDVGDVQVLYRFLEDRIFWVSLLARGCYD